MMSGASVLPGRVARSRCRLSWPAIFATLLILFVRAIESFEVPALLGLPVGIQVFTSAIYQAVHRYPSQVGLASAYARDAARRSPPSACTSSRGCRAAASQYATMTGKGFRPRQIDLGRWRWLDGGDLRRVLPADRRCCRSSCCCGRRSRSSTRCRRWTALQNLTLDPYRFIFSYPNLDRASVLNSLLLAVRRRPRSSCSSRR